MAQFKKVVRYNDTHGSFTVRELFEKEYMNSPTRVISDMRDKGYEFEQTWEKSKNSRYLRYRIITRPEGDNDSSD